VGDRWAGAAGVRAAAAALPARPGPLACEQLKDGASARPLAMLALVAVAVVDLAMLPYLAAVALLSAVDLGQVARAGATPRSSSACSAEADQRGRATSTWVGRPWTRRGDLA
jgi:hypothetical protein